MKRLLLILAVFMPILGIAAEGDTIKVRSHNRVHLNWNGNFDRKAHFPTQGKSFNKVLMHYTLGCPDKGCSEWDYTTQVFLRRKTGRMDSTQRLSPNFKIGTATPDSFRYALDSTYSYFYNAGTMSIDSMANQPVQMIRFLDAQNPTTPSDTLTVWDASIYRPVYDQNGAAIDSSLIAFEQIVYKQQYIWYQVFEVIENLELGRVITPYAGGKTKEWSHTYTFDVTDFAFLLEDSVDIRARYSGFQDGFTITLDFELIEGTPSLECYKIVSLWQGSFPYGNPNNSIENYLKNVRVAPEAMAKEAKLRVIQTGHGFGGNENCAEFCAKSHYLKVNGQQKASALLWRDDCGMNALYPQPGTWLYDRANWCPGSAVDPNDYFIGSYLSATDSTDLDLDMQPFTNVNNNNCSYIVSGMVFYYKEITYKKDLSIEEIMAPNKDSRYVRYNPTCGDPYIRIRNNGSDTIRSAEFKYGIFGGKERTWRWTGTLAPYSSQSIYLANFDWTGASTGLFYVEASKVDGQADELAINNRNASSFELVPQLPNAFQVWFRTNLQPDDNSIHILDASGKELWKRSFTQANTNHADTIRLVSGCYAFEIVDESKNGIKFWANSAGTGSLTLRALSGSVLKVVEGDFGTAYRYYFTAGYPLSNQLPEAQFQLFPNPGHKQVAVSHAAEAYDIRILDVQGRVVWNGKSSGTETRLATESWTSGVYFVELSNAESKGIQKLVIQH